ncbi:MAG: hypothetical protein M0Z43_02975, partial [Acidithiobacillus sp.]|nr:hypothetical protein [Acidithiobacillus sp.]
RGRSRFHLQDGLDQAAGGAGVIDDGCHRHDDDEVVDDGHAGFDGGQAAIHAIELRFDVLLPGAGFSGRPGCGRGRVAPHGCEASDGGSES